MLIRGYTVIVLPPGGNRIRRVRLRSWLAAGLFLVGLAVLGTAGYFGYDYYTLKQFQPDLDRLEKENLAQRTQLLAFSEKIGELQAEMEKLGQFNKKLKAVLNPDNPEEAAGQFVGQGGFETDTARPSGQAQRSAREVIRNMHQDLARLQEDASVAEQVQQEMQSFLESRKSALAATPSIWPSRGWVTSGFGHRRDPYTGRREFHRGVDIANGTGTPVVAPALGVVVKEGWESGYGRVLIVHHGYGLSTMYAHLSKTLVKPGQQVKRGQRIALVGASGRTTGSHLHYEVLLNGVPVNPANYILN